MYSVSQGAMAVECRDDDQETLKLLSSLHHFSTLLQVIAERAFLKTLVGYFMKMAQSQCNFFEKPFNYFNKKYSGMFLNINYHQN